ncbi:hypothetical protein H8356DRAFT_1430208 [Neocallimastix lanati (nom. inval.)]|nr:hypothetical protein H8356DRAFT_1430208 [Neocallimastix sp. JGI-2020a]
MDDQLEISETSKEKNQIIYSNVLNIKHLKNVNLYIILNDNNKDASVSIVKHKMKYEIRKTSIPFDINPKHIYNEISEEIGLIYESEYYINERDENFMIFKNSNKIILIFQSPFQTELIDAPEINRFYTTSLSILNNKEQATYEWLFEELKKECISNAAIKIFPNITIKYCVWHYKRSLEESELIDKKCDKNDIIDLWYTCLLELNKL